jgi:hypothetical protein
MTLGAVLPGRKASILQTAWAAGDGEEIATPNIEAQEELEQDLEGVDYLCKFCRRKITTASEKIVVNGQHTHMCANPYGLLFEVGCFARASGCLTTGVPTLEFTWFPGYAWSIALCANCANHMGWHYTAQPPSEFYGLILDHLVQASNSG